MADHHQVPGLPASAVYVRTTTRFTEATIPSGLLRDHRTAPDTWAVVRVMAGRLDLVFDDDGHTVSIGSEAAGVIEPDRFHHLVIDGPVELEVDFYTSD